MLFAIVDIETTGSYASANGITEIAIAIHDGTKVIDYYESLVNPRVPIPFFIQRLTGIDDDMVAGAPAFHEIAPVVYELLQDKIFVAHNVNFDYSFVKHHLKAAGFELETKKLCTVRLARKVLPGMASYSLGKLTTYLGINHGQAHRAGGDTLATADLFTLIVAKDTAQVIESMLKGKSKESYLPPHLSVDELDKLPSSPGVYYFHNSNGKIIYVGKAKNLYKRVKSHFSNNKTTRQKQDFIRETHRISYKPWATELMAEIMESAEIRRIWPMFNRSQKGYLPQFALIAYVDQQGFTRFAIEKNRAGRKPVYTFNTVGEGRRRLREMADEFGLCIKLCNMNADYDLAAECTCKEHAAPDEYNIRAAKALEGLKKRLPTFAFVDKGMDDNEHSCILVLEGAVFGLGYLENEKAELKDLEALKNAMDPIKDNDFIRNLIFRYAAEQPEKCILI